MTTILRDLLGLTGLVIFFVAVLLAVELRPPVTGPVLVVVNPFGPPAIEIIAASNGLVIGAGPVAWIASGTDAGDSLFRHGIATRAVLILNAASALCATPNAERSGL